MWKAVSELYLYNKHSKTTIQCAFSQKNRPSLPNPTESNQNRNKA